MNLKDEILSNIKRGNLGLIPLKGTSMLPTLFDGDVLSVYAKRDYTVGDIIVFFYRAKATLSIELLEWKRVPCYVKVIIQNESK